MTRPEITPAGTAQFADAVARMEPLLAAPARRVADHPAVPNTPGIYLFTEGGRAIYVGQSRKLRARLRHHTVATSKQNQASFAFNIAKLEAKRAGVDTARFREVLQADAGFDEHFTRAKSRVAQMVVRFIELADPIERTLFEVYAALALDTAEFNTFETH